MNTRNRHDVGRNRGYILRRGSKPNPHGCTESSAAVSGPNILHSHTTCILRYCKEHAALHGHKCAFWADRSPCGNSRQDNRLTCEVHAGKEDEFNRRNREASWTAAQRAKFLKKEVSTFIVVPNSNSVHDRRLTCGTQSKFRHAQSSALKSKTPATSGGHRHRQTLCSSPSSSAPFKHEICTHPMHAHLPPCGPMHARHVR